MSEQIERGIAKEVMKKIYISTPKETDQMCIYQNGIFIHERFDSTIRQKIQEIANETYVTNTKEEIKKYHLSMARQHMIIEFIKGYTDCSLDDFDSNDRIINLKNGLYYLDGYEGIIINTGEEPQEVGGYEFEQISKGIKYFQTFEEYIRVNKKPYKSFIQIPVNYNPEIESLEIDQIFEDIFGFNTVPLIYEMIGYFLLPNTKYSKAFMFYGETGTGKTTAINIITQFIGYENISGIELQKLDDKFELEKTRNKLINIFDDLSSKPIKYVGNFKKLVTNTWLYGRIKFIQEEIRWVNRCKGLFACNVLPKIKEYVTDAFYTRWVLIPCFDKDDKIRDNRDTKLREKKFSDEELSGLLNKVIQALQRLEERSNFPVEWQNIEFVKNQWNMDINPVALFVEECCEINASNYEIDYELFYKQLNQFRKEKRVKEISKTLMTRSLNKFNENIQKKKVNRKTTSIESFPSGHKFIGIQFKLEYIEDHLEIQNNKLTVEKYMNEG